MYLNAESQAILNQIKWNCEIIAFELNKIGINALAWNNTSCLEFLELPIEAQELKLKILQNYCDCIEKLSASSEKFTELNFLKYFFQISGIKLPRQIESILNPSIVIEIHNLEGTQIFRNFEAFRYISFTILELSCFHWNHLYLRNTAVEAKLFESISMVLNSTNPDQIFNPEIPIHEVVEKKSNPMGVKLEFSKCVGLRGNSNKIEFILSTKFCEKINAEKENLHSLFELR